MLINLRQSSRKEERSVTGNRKHNKLFPLPNEIIIHKTWIVWQWSRWRAAYNANYPPSATECTGAKTDMHGRLNCVLHRTHQSKLSIIISKHLSRKLDASYAKLELFQILEQKQCNQCNRLQLIRTQRQ